MEHKLVLILSLIITLSACTNFDRHIEQAEESFTTKITQNNLKLFSYNLSMDLPQHENGRPNRSKNGERGNGRGGGYGNYGINTTSRNKKSSSSSKMNQIKEKVDARLQLKLKETGYCREGYIELDSYLSDRGFQIRGECEESATPKDHELFTLFLIHGQFRNY